MAELRAAERAVFERNGWFAALSPALKARLFEGASRVSLAAGQRLYARDEAPTGWYGLLSGAIRVGNVTPDGVQLTLAYVEPGDWLGELSIIDGLPRSHDGIAQGPTDALVVAPALFRSLCEEFPELPRALLAMQAQRMRLMFAAIEDLNVLPFEARLAKQLLNLAKSYGVDGPEGIDISLRLPQEDLAQLLGVSRQRINQELKSLERQGVLSARYGRIRISDLVTLERASRSERLAEVVANRK